VWPRDLCASRRVAVARARRCAGKPHRGDGRESALPPGEGRDIVAVTCSQCHGLSAITHLREGRVAWRHQIYDMVGRGAQVTPAEIDTMVNYLVANFGPGIPFPGQTPSSVAIAPGTGSDVVMQKCPLWAFWPSVLSVGAVTYLLKELLLNRSRRIRSRSSVGFRPSTARNVPGRLRPPDNAQHASAQESWGGIPAKRC
jgi:hypothetical protein